MNTIQKNKSEKKYLKRSITRKESGKNFVYSKGSKGEGGGKSKWKLEDADRCHTEEDIFVHHMNSTSRHVQLG